MRISIYNMDRFWPPVNFLHFTYAICSWQFDIAMPNCSCEMFKFCGCASHNAVTDNSTGVSSTHTAAQITVTLSCAGRVRVSVSQAIKGLWSVHKRLMKLAASDDVEQRMSTSLRSAANEATLTAETRSQTRNVASYTSQWVICIFTKESPWRVHTGTLLNSHVL